MRIIKIVGVMLVISIVSVALYAYNAIKSEEYIATEHVEIKNVHIKDGEWIVDGYLTHPKENIFIFKKGFNGFDYKEVDGDAYIKLNYGVISGEPAYYFSLFLENKLDNVQKVYIQGNSVDDVKLIHQKQED